MRSLLSVPVNRDYVDPTYGWDGYVTGYNLPMVIEASEGELREALVQVDQATQPLPDERIVLEINKLKVRCKMRAEQQEDMQMLIACLLDDLSEYPADVVVDVLKAWPRRSPWWPSWNELYEQLERKSAPRRAIRDVIKHALKEHEEPSPWRDFKLPTNRLLDNI
ncbi:MAG: hypothetical protein ACR2RF_03690 [Geminicoccaceae bacterium]